MQWTSCTHSSRCVIVKCVEFLVMDASGLCPGTTTLSAQAAGIRVKVDDSPGKTPGWKFNHWEMRGVPVRIEV